jgi:hypothetical protein
VSGSVAQYEKEQLGDEDLLSLAAVQVLVKGGTVFMVQPEDLFGNGSAAGSCWSPLRQA